MPPFPSSGDRGFAPRTYFEIEPGFGTWEDIERIAGRFDVLLDLMVNHISRDSSYFQDFLQHGKSSQYASMFLTLDKIWANGEPPREDLDRIFLRRPDHPFVEILVGETGERERVWATFGGPAWSEQIDLDVHAPQTRQFFHRILDHLSCHGVRILRLDAIAYVMKKAGNSCFFVEPEI